MHVVTSQLTGRSDRNEPAARPRSSKAPSVWYAACLAAAEPIRLRGPVRTRNGRLCQRTIRGQAGEGASAVGRAASTDSAVTRPRSAVC
jgi:hypothetical protein